MNHDGEEQLNDQDDPEKVYCANCHHCKIVKGYTNSSCQQYVLRVRCSQRMWKKKLGDEKLYKYFTVARRVMDSCDQYSPMGDNPSNYLRELRKTLPIRDEVYQEDKDAAANPSGATG